MADDVTFQSSNLATPPSGTVVAGDLIGGSVYQRVKPAFGADGSATDVSSSDPLPVTDAAVGATSDAAVTTDTTGTASGKLRGLVKWAFERMPASLGSKTSANSLPVVVASDQAAIAVTDNSGSLTVDSSIKTLYGTEAQVVTCTLTSLASSATAGRESTAVDNTTNLFRDVLVYAHVKIDSGTIGNDKRVYVWAYGTVDAATPLYPDTVTGSDAAITLTSPTNLRLLGIIECPAQSTTYKAGPWSLAQLFGSVPEKWGVVVQNYTNIALTGTAGDHKVLYQGVNGKLV